MWRTVLHLYKRCKTLPLRSCLSSNCQIFCKIVHVQILMCWQNSVDLIALCVEHYLSTSSSAMTVHTFCNRCIKNTITFLSCHRLRNLVKLVLLRLKTEFKQRERFTRAGHAQSVTNRISLLLTNQWTWPTRRLFANKESSLMLSMTSNPQILIWHMNVASYHLQEKTTTWVRMVHWQTGHFEDRLISRAMQYARAYHSPDKN